MKKLIRIKKIILLSNIIFMVRKDMQGRIATNIKLSLKRKVINFILFVINQIFLKFFLKPGGLILVLQIT